MFKLINFRRIKNGLKFILLEIQKTKRRIIGEPIIEVIGDSHSLLFQSEYFNINYIGPATAYRLGADQSTNESKSKILKIVSSKTKNKSRYFLLVFGEIDARIHIYKASQEKGISIADAISQTVTNYMKYIQELQEKYPKYLFIVFNILPQGNQGNIYKYSHYADRNTRVAITKQLNETLKKSCEQQSIPFIEVYNELIDTNSERKSDLIFDEIHYSNKIVPYIIPTIKTTLLKRGIKI